MTQLHIHVILIRMNITQFFIDNAVNIVVLILSVLIFSIILSGKLSKFKFGLGPLKFETDCTQEQTDMIKKLWSCIESLKAADKKVMNALDNIEKTINTLHDDVQSTSISQRKLVFYSDDMPIAERLIAGLKYLASGHNHQFGSDVVAMAVKHEDIYRAVVSLDASLRSKRVEDAFTGQRK